MTTFISTGPGRAATATSSPSSAGASEDGSRVFCETDEPLVAGDTDTLAGRVSGLDHRPGRIPAAEGRDARCASALVPAYQRVHDRPTARMGRPSPSPRATRRARTSPQLTVGSPDANGKAANSSGSVKFEALPGVSSTPADEADVRIVVSITDVRRRSDLTDYTGQLQLDADIRMTDRLNGSSPVDTGTASDLPFPVTVPCARDCRRHDRLDVRDRHHGGRRAAGRRTRGQALDLAAGTHRAAGRRPGRARRDRGQQRVRHAGRIRSLTP